MIASLDGKITEIGLDHCVINVSGVGYVLTCSSQCLQELRSGQTAHLVVETRMRAESLELFGFYNVDERQWFRLLITVQGVGAKVALAMLSTMSTSSLMAAIMSGDAATLSRADGVGPKLAKRICSELKDRVANMKMPVLEPSSGLSSGGVSTAKGENKKEGGRHPDTNEISREEAISALVNLGYARVEAFEAVNLVLSEARGEDTDTSFVLKKALSRLAVQ